MFFESVSSRKEISNNESGAILILTALLITVLFTFIALGVDVSIYYNQDMEEGTVASDGAFAALEAYGLMPAGSSFTARKARAKTRAREIVGLTLNKKLGDKFLEPGGGATQAIICYDNDPGNDCTNPNNINGRIRDGQYHWGEPGGVGGCATYRAPWNGQSCPCAGGSFTGPCFEQNDPAGAAGTPPATSASAFQITLGTQQAAPIGNIFGRFLSVSQQVAPAQGTATAIPRKVMFLVDTSGSMIRDNHRRIGTHGSEAALALNSGYTCTDGTTVCQVSDAMPATHTCDFLSNNQEWKWYDNENGLSGAALAPAMQLSRAAYDSAKYNPPGPLSTGDPLFAEYHFKDDYRCSVQNYLECSGCIDDDIGNCSGGCSTRTDYYLVDQYRDFTAGGSTPYYGPEPLFSVLNGINVAIQTMKARGTPGDAVGARFFDSSASLFNTDYPDPNFNFSRSFPLTAIIDPASNDAAEQLEDATLVTDPASNPSQQLQRMLFPRSSVSTNLPEALTIAMNNFAAQPDFESAQNLVVIFTDGRTNCYQGACNNTWTSHQQSMNEAMGIIAGQYVPARVSVNWFLVGGATGQHNLLRKTGNNTCMTDEEARYGSYSWTDGDFDGLGVSMHDYSAVGDYQDQWIGQQSGDIGYMPFANQLYDAALITSGVWETIRKCCDSTCSGSATNITPLCSGGVAGDLVTNGGGILAADELDSEGRLLCDPENRTSRQQIEDGIVNIFSKSPFVLVQ